MTEIYHGPWNPVSGDTPKVVVPDVYHRYPAPSQVKAETERQPVKTEETAAQSE